LTPFRLKHQFVPMGVSVSSDSSPANPMRGLLDQDGCSTEGQSPLRLLMTLMVLCGVSLSGTFSVSTVRMGESESPFEVEEELEKDAEEAVASRKRCIRLRRGAGKSGRLSCESNIRSRILSRPPFVPTGHRYPNGVSAPLTC
jgi:hypothetical protein